MFRKTGAALSAIALAASLGACSSIVRDPDPMPNDPYAHSMSDERAADKADRKMMATELITVAVLFAGGWGLAMLQPAPVALVAAAVAP